MFETILTYSEIRKIVGAAHFASTDTMTPVLSSVQLKTDGETLYAYATDRFTLIETTVTTNTEGDCDTVINVEDVKRWKALTSKASEADRRATLTIDGYQWTLAASDGSSLTGTARYMDGTYPDLRKLIPDNRTLYPTVAAMASDKVARLDAYDRAVRRPKNERAWHIGASKDPALTEYGRPPMIAISPDVRVLIMPLKLADYPNGYHHD